MKFRLVERLIEDNNMISSKLFNIKDHSNEAYELLDSIDNRLFDIKNNLFTDVDIDDTGMNSYGSVDGDRTIEYKANIFAHSVGRIYKPLNKKEFNMLRSEILATLTLPPEDDKYEYSVDVSQEGLSISIKFNREEKW